MSAGADKLWLLGYDIARPARLRRVARRVGAIATPVQYSLYALTADDREMQRHMHALQALIDPRHDDLRAWHISERCQIETAGRQVPDDGIWLAGYPISRLFGTPTGAPTRSATPTAQNLATPSASNCAIKAAGDERSGPLPRSEGD